MNWLEKSEVNIVFTVLIFTIFTILLGYEWYFSVKNNIKLEDWNNKYKCRWYVQPISGWINPFIPDNETPFINTQKNLQFCNSGFFSNAISSVFKTVDGALGDISLPLGGITDLIQMIRNKISELLTAITDALGKFSAPILAMLPAIQLGLLRINSIFMKLSLVWRSIYYMLMGVFQIGRDILVKIKSIVTTFLIALGVTILLLWVFFWTWPAAAVATALYAAIAVPFGYVIYQVGNVLTIHEESLGGSGCLDKNTPISLINGNKIPISKINVGDILHDGGKVTATFKYSSKGQRIYNLNGVIVSETHNVLYNNEWVSVTEHPDSILINNYDQDILYCLNTTTHKICINDIIFSDWDDIDETEQHLLPYKNTHRYLDAGFIGETLIENIMGEKKPIKDLKIGDILKNGEQILGTVIIDGNDMENIKEYTIDGTTFTGGPNIRLKYLGTTRKMKGKKVIQPNKLYHIITNSRSFTINNLLFYDYNSALELFLSINYV